MRSSAQGEDGAEASFAGQYDTVLNVGDGTELRAAIDRCVDSAGADRAAEYQQDRAGAATATMNVVVQRMVDARVAGVVFTADPASARRDLLVIDAVAGLGEALVSGEATPDHYGVNAGGEVVRRQLVGATPLLSDAEIAAIAHQARAAAAHEGRPLDLEWAIDRAGELFWLQARPITTLPADLNEFDTTLPRPDDVLTISNVSEMMPGAVCPLTMSFTGSGIDYGLQHMQATVGARAGIDERWQITASAYGHLFLNLTGNVVLSAGVLGSSADQAAQTLCGRVVPELRELPPLPLPRRALNSARLVRYCLEAPRVVERFGRELDRFAIAERPDSTATWNEIAGQRWFFDHAMAVHIQSSALSGFLNAIVENMVSAESNASTVEEQAETVRLLAGASGVESAVMLDELDDLVDLVARHPDAAHEFQGVPVEDATTWLRGTPELADGFEAFLADHGHRGYRELCVRDPSWRDDPTPLIQSMQAAVHARLVTGAHRELHAEVIDWDELGRGLRSDPAEGAQRRSSPGAHQVTARGRGAPLPARVPSPRRADGVRGPASRRRPRVLLHHRRAAGVPGRPAARSGRARHRTSRRVGPPAAVRVPRDLRRSSRAAGAAAGRAGRRRAPRAAGLTRASSRVWSGSPTPSTDAAALEPGEILVTPITDIGWTPYFSLIGGLVTDLGSSVSHGAVIAREYGLPCVVNTRQATHVLHTGDRVRLDGDTGCVTLLADGAAGDPHRQAGAAQ